MTCIFVAAQCRLYLTWKLAEMLHVGHDQEDLLWQGLSRRDGTISSTSLAVGEAMMETRLSTTITLC